MSKIYVKVLGDNFAVGSFKSGTDLLQNLYGQYLGLAEKPLHDSVNTAIHAADLGWNVLHSTHLGFAPVEDVHSLHSIISGIDQGVLSTYNLIRVKRDYKDVLVNIWKTVGTDLSWDEFIASSLGYSLIKEFEVSANAIKYNFTIEYKDLVNEPQKVLTKLIDHLAPKAVCGDEVVKDAVANLDYINEVVSKSQIRELRANPDSTYLEKVDVYAEWITPEQAEHVDAFVASL